MKERAACPPLLRVLWVPVEVGRECILQASLPQGCLRHRICVAEVSERREAILVHVVASIDVKVEVAVLLVVHLLAARDHRHDCLEGTGLQCFGLDGLVEGPLNWLHPGAAHQVGTYQPRKVLAGEGHGTTVVRIRLQYVHHGIGDAEVGQVLPVSVGREDQGLGHLQRLLCDLVLMAMLPHQLHCQLWEALLEADVLIHPTA
mmetsp:Transcript_66602/g.194811  ORF Transcript_66602/g.194811 Transcript_66602/m.194811 type:complete len:203 (-) Transcript_66602:657-1265(-)